MQVDVLCFGKRTRLGTRLKPNGIIVALYRKGI